MIQRLKRWIAPATLAASSLLLFAQVASVQALPTHRSYIVWYQTNTFTGWNGEKTVECNGDISVSGSLNGFSRVEDYESCGSTNFCRVCFEKDIGGVWHAVNCP